MATEGKKRATEALFFQTKGLFYLTEGIFFLTEYKKAAAEDGKRATKGLFSKRTVISSEMRAVVVYG